MSSRRHALAVKDQLRYRFLLFFTVLLMVASMNLGTCLLTVLFGHLALQLRES